MDLQACLPAALRGPSTTISPIAAGLSGAGVYRVEAEGQAFVLKIGRAEQPIAEWRRALAIVRAVSDAGVAPRLVHADEDRRAVVTVFVVDQTFPARLGNPATRGAAVVELGEMLRRVHDVALPEGLVVRDPRELLGMIQGWLTGFAIPGFAADNLARARAEEPPPRERPTVLIHGDLNPSNLIFDGERLMLVDWDTAGAGDAFYDLAAIALFMRFDDDTCRALIAAHDGAAIDRGPLPAMFAYSRKLVAVLIGSMFMHLARLAGHAGANGDETVASAPDLVTLYGRMREGSLGLHTGDGRWSFGLALHKIASNL